MNELFRDAKGAPFFDPVHAVPHARRTQEMVLRRISIRSVHADIPDGSVVEVHVNMAFPQAWMFATRQVQEWLWLTLGESAKC